MNPTSQPQQPNTQDAQEEQIIPQTQSNSGTSPESPQSQPANETPPEPSKPKKKLKRSTLILLIVCGILVVAALVAFCIVSQQNNDNSLSNIDWSDYSIEETEPTPVETGPGTIVAEEPLDCSSPDEQSTQAVSDICSVIQGYEAYLLTQTNDEIKAEYSYVEDQGPAYQPEYASTAIYTTPNHISYVASYESKNDIPASFTEYLLNNGFTLNGEFGWLSADDKAFKTYINPTTGVVCDAFTKVKCSHKDWYPAADNEGIQIINQLVVATEKAGEFKIRGAVVYIAENPIENSSIAPYQTVSLSALNAHLSFYRTSPNSEWIFFGGTQQGFMCSEFDTEDEKKAYAGETCLLENGDYNGAVTYP